MNKLIERWRPSGRGVTVVLSVVLVAALGRLTVSGVLPSNIPINISENFGPLFGLLIEERPIQQLGPRQYGVVAFLLVDPIIRVEGRSERALNLWGLGLGIAGIALAFVLVVRRFQIRRARLILGLALLWAGYLPLIDALAMRLFDLPVFGMIAATFYFYTAPHGHRRWAGVTAAAAFLTKLLPAIFLPFLLIRERRAFIYGLVAIAVLLIVGHILYGPMMGLGYPVFLVRSTPEATFTFSFQNENNSVRGLLFKIGAGFRIARGAFTASTPYAGLLNGITYGVTISLLAYLLYVVFRYRKTTEGLPRRSVEFALAIVTMYLIAPHASHEHMVSLILVFTVIAWLRLNHHALVPRSAMLLAAASLALIGVYLPMTAVAALVPVHGMMRWLGNENSAIYGSAIGEYNFLGFPGAGLVLLWVALVVLERRTRLAPGLAPMPAYAQSG